MPDGVLFALPVHTSYADAFMMRQRSAVSTAFLVDASALSPF
jgi:hypothetical protein